MADDQRSYFRLDDKLKLSWREVAEGDAQSDAEVSAELLELNDQLSNLISLAFQHSAPVGEALGLLNRKLELMLKDHSNSDVPLKQVNVNISGAGIGFGWNGTATVDTEIDVTLVLRPSNVTVSLRGRVLRCESGRFPGESHWIGVKFNEGQDIAVEQIVHHVAHRQTEMLASRHRREMLERELHPDDDDD